MKTRAIVLAIIAAGVMVSILIFTMVRPYILRPANSSAQYHLTEVAAGLTRPLYLTSANDDSGRMFIVEQDGYIRILTGGKILEKPFLDVSALVSRDDSERGLLGLAFHPRYAENGQFFINYTDRNGNTVVARDKVSSADLNQADPNPVDRVIVVDQPYPNHNAGQLAFGPDGDLYIGLGDGGSEGDLSGNGQNPKALLGKMLRLDIDHGLPYSIPPDNPFAHNPDFAPEIWALGLRNPWRYSFDRLTGDFYIGDVGQSQWEEVDFQPAHDKGGENYGWNAFEGNHPYSTNTTAPQNVTMPVAGYSHADGCSIVGGYVYRGSALPDLQGYYIFGDFCGGTIWVTKRDDTGSWQTKILMNSGHVISSFGEDQDGELYLMDYGGSVFRFDKSS